MRQSPSRPLEEGLGLDRLPWVAPPRDTWPEIAARIARERRNRRQWPQRLALVGAAALLLVVAGWMVQLSTQIDEQAHALAEWIDYSQELERELDALRRGGQSLRGHRAMVMGELEDRVAAVDLALTRGRTQRMDPEVELALWRQRAVLMNDLVTVQAGARLEPAALTPQPVMTLNPPSGNPARRPIHEL